MIRVSVPQPAPPADLNALHVAKAAWGKGIGKTLTPDVARMTGARSVWREVPGCNLPPRAIHKAWRGTEGAARAVPPVGVPIVERPVTWPLGAALADRLEGRLT